MRTYLLIAALLLALPVVAQETAPAQQQTGHVLSAEVHQSHGTVSAHNPAGYTHGSTRSVESETDIQVGNLVYESAQVHKEVVVGKDYRVTIETDKHGSPKKLQLFVGDKTYTFHIAGTREVKAN